MSWRWKPFLQQARSPLLECAGSDPPAEMDPDSDQRDQHNQNEHQCRGEFNRLDVGELTVSKPTNADPHAIAAIGEIDKDERRDRRHDNRREHHSKEQKT